MKQVYTDDLEGTVTDCVEGLLGRGNSEANSIKDKTIQYEDGGIVTAHDLKDNTRIIFSIICDFVREISKDDDIEGIFDEFKRQIETHLMSRVSDVSGEYPQLQILVQEFVRKQITFVNDKFGRQIKEFFAVFLEIVPYEKMTQANRGTYKQTDDDEIKHKVSTYINKFKEHSIVTFHSKMRHVLMSELIERIRMNLHAYS